MLQKSEVVVITGASAGVGRATVWEFARRGAHIALLARGSAGLEAAKAEAEALGAKAIILPVDVEDPEQVETAAAAVEDILGPIDIWINNAMLSVFSPAHLMEPEEYERVTEVTYLGYVYGTLAALRYMSKRNRGTIVQVGSALSYRSIPLQSAYCGAKHAVRGFTDSLRSELIHDGIHVHLTMVQLPAHNTPQFDWVKSRLPGKPQPVPPIFQPEVAARAIYWAAHHRRRELFVGFPAVKAFWGNVFFPGLVDRYLARFGYTSQLSNEPNEPNRPHNLWGPLPGDFGAHGRFDDHARSYSPHLWVNTHRLWTAAIAAAGALAVTYTIRRWSSMRSSLDRDRTASPQPSSWDERAV